MEKIYEFSIIGRIRIDAHSLNNEGTVGNVTEPRTIVLADGSKTDGISGEMLKHMHMRNMWALAEDKNILCDACKNLSPLKASKSLTKEDKKNSIAALKAALNCMLCDTHGFLVEELALARKSTLEFGWALALPENLHRDIHLHTRVEPGEKSGRTEEPTAQMIYNRPTRSGVYATISLFQPWRIGLSEIDYKYIIDDTERKQRYELALNAYKALFAQLPGAMSTTRLPHIGNCSGTIVISKKAVPVPIVSPLSKDYTETVNAISKNLGMEAREFTSMEALVNTLENMKTFTPYKLK